MVDLLCTDKGFLVRGFNFVFLYVFLLSSGLGSRRVSCFFVCLEGMFIMTVGSPWFIVLGVLLLVLAALLLGKMLISSEDEPIGMGWVITVAVGLLAVFVCAFIISPSLGVMLLVVFVLGALVLFPDLF